MASIPRGRQGARTRRLSEIPGIVPSLREAAPGQPAFQGCAFAPRCAFATPRCHSQAPPLLQYDATGIVELVQGQAVPGMHLAACWEIDKVLAS